MRKSYNSLYLIQGESNPRFFTLEQGIPWNLGFADKNLGF